MLTLIERIKGTLEEFVEQRDDLVLVVACSDADAAMVLKLIEDVEQANTTDLFLLFAHEFKNKASFVDSIIEHLREQHRLACQALGEQGRDPYPALPMALADQAISPVRRLGLAMTYARSLIPKDGGHRVIWAMFPIAIADRTAYLELVNAFAPYNGIRPGMQGLRIIFRDEPNTAAAAPQLATAPRVQLHDVDLGPEGIEKALREEVENDELPLERRMAALLQNALIDAAHGRFQDAFIQFQVLLGHYQHTRNYALQALIINAIGEAYRRLNNNDKARHYLECAVPLAVEAKSAALLQMVTKNLGDLAFETERYAEAERFYEGAEQLAAKTLDVEGRAHALERRGVSQEKLGALDRAIESWEEAAAFSRNLGLRDHLRTNLQHLIRGHQQSRQAERLAAARAELRVLEEEERAEAERGALEA